MRGLRASACVTGVDAVRLAGEMNECTLQDSPGPSDRGRDHAVLRSTGHVSRSAHKSADAPRMTLSPRRKSLETKRSCAVSWAAT